MYIEAKAHLGFENTLCLSCMYIKGHGWEKQPQQNLEPLEISPACKIAQELLLLWWGSVNDND